MTIDVLRLFVAQGELFAELAEPGCLDGVELAAHTPIAVRAGNVIEIRGQALRIGAIESSVLETRLLGARLERLPRGGRVTFVFADGERTVYLPGRRYRLVAALLVPPAPFAPGDLIPDSELVPVVWNDTDEVGGRKELNVVLTRTRQDLVAAGISAKLLVRAQGGRATQIAIDPMAPISEVDVQSAAPQALQPARDKVRSADRRSSGDR